MFSCFLSHIYFYFTLLVGDCYLLLIFFTQLLFFHCYFLCLFSLLSLTIDLRIVVIVVFLFGNFINLSILSFIWLFVSRPAMPAQCPMSYFRGSWSTVRDSGPGCQMQAVPSGVGGGGRVRTCGFPPCLARLTVQPESSRTLYTNTLSEWDKMPISWAAGLLGIPLLAWSYEMWVWLLIDGSLGIIRTRITTIAPPRRLLICNRLWLTGCL